MQTQLNAIRTGGSNEEVELKASRYGDLRIAQYLPRYAMLAASGQVFAFDTSAGTAKAPDTALPTDSPEWTIYNDNPSGGKHIVLLWVGIMSTTGCSGLGLCVAATSGIGAQTAVTSNYAGAGVCSCLDGTAKQPNAYIGNNPSIIGTQPAWAVFDTLDQAATVSVGTGVVAYIDGLVIAPPKGGVFIAVVGAAGSTFLLDATIVVAEIQLDT